MITDLPVVSKRWLVTQAANIRTGQDPHIILANQPFIFRRKDDSFEREAYTRPG